MPAVALYARYSSDLQNPCSIDDQLYLCREYAARQGWTVVGCYHDEAVSGAAIRGRNGAIRMLEDASAGRFDVVCAEALDRISRDQEDIAHVYKRLCFERIALNTVAEGQVNEMHIGLKGTMNAIFLKDLAEKTRRGQRGRIEKGRSGGGLAYGYDVVLADESGAGARVINEDQARVVRRIFSNFADGMTPGAIADMLNSEGVRGSAGRPWGATTIRGHRVRATGILNNPLYRGELVWNRQSFVKDPVTGKRQARMNPEERSPPIAVPVPCSSGISPSACDRARGGGGLVAGPDHQDAGGRHPPASGLQIVSYRQVWALGTIMTLLRAGTLRIDVDKRFRHRPSADEQS